MPYFHAVDGSRLFYSAWGSGRPIVFIHGGNAGADFWEFQVPALVKKDFSASSMTNAASPNPTARRQDTKSIHWPVTSTG